MKNVCNDNLLYYYILNSRKISIATEMIAFVISIIVIVLFVIHYKKQKENHTLKKDFIKTIVILLILFIIPFSLNHFATYIKNHSNYSACVEQEEINAIEETDIVAPTIVEPKRQEELRAVPQDIEETIEVIEEDNEEEKIEEINRDNHFYFLNVGAGTEAIIIEDQGKFGLIDTSYNSKASFILKQLKMLGAKELDFIIITHSHLDHMGGYSKIMSNINVNTLYIKNPGNVNSDYVPTYLSMIREAEDKGTAICNVTEEICQNFNIGYINIQLYNTDFYTSKGIDGLDRSRIENANSIVAVATINQRKIYFASDIGDYYNYKAETLTAAQIGDIDVYKVAHHGYVSYNNNIQALSYLKPEYNIVTNNKELSLTAVKRIKQTNKNYKKTYYTTDGTVTLHVAGDGTLEFEQ